MGVTHCCFSRDEPDLDGELPQAYKIAAIPQGWNGHENGSRRETTPRYGDVGLPRTPRVAGASARAMQPPNGIDPARMAYYMDSEKQVSARSARQCGLFLDVDGVLHPYGAFGKESFCHMELLLQILDATRCDIVLSSSWRMDTEGLQEVNNRLMEARPDVENVEILDITERTRGSINRVGNRDIEIAAWVRDHAKEAGWDNRWIALDDLDLTQALGREHAVVTVCEVGLTEDKVAEAIDKLTALNEEDLVAM